MRKYLMRCGVNNRLKSVTEFERQAFAAGAVAAVGVGQAIVAKVNSVVRNFIFLII